MPKHTFTWKRRHSSASMDIHSRQFPAGNQTRDNLFCHTLISTSLPLFSCICYSLFFFFHPVFFSSTQRRHLLFQYSSHVSAPPSKNTPPQIKSINLPSRSSSSSLSCQSSPRKLDLLSGSVSSSSCSSSFPLCARTPALLSPVREGFSVRSPPSVSLSAPSSLLPLASPNDFSPSLPLSLSPFVPPSHSLVLDLLLCFAPVYRQLVLPLHLFSSSCATALSMQPVSPSLMRAPVSLCANSCCPSPPSVCLLLLPSCDYSAIKDCCLHECEGFACSSGGTASHGNNTAHFFWLLRSFCHFWRFYSSLST